MVQHDINAPLSQAPAEEADSDGLDFEQLTELTGFVLRAGRRHRKLAIATFAVVAGLGITAAATMPKTYSAQVKIFAQRPSTLRALSGSAHDIDQVDDPTKNVANMILRRDNLVALVRQANLADRFTESRAPAFRLKDRITTWLYGPPSDEDKLKVLVATLEKKLDIFTDESTVVMTVDWPSAQMAYDLVSLVQKNFLEARYDRDLALITDSIGVLQDHAKAENEKVETALAEYQRCLIAALPLPAAPAVAAAPSPFRGYVPPPRAAVETAPPVDPGLSLALEEVRLKMKALEHERQVLLDSLHQQLSQAQLTLTPMHPTVIALQQKIEALSQPSPELLRLREEERNLAAQVAQAATPSVQPAAPPMRFGGAAPSTESSATPSGSSAPTPRPVVEDGPTRLARSRLEAAIQGYEETMAHIDAANVELEITRTAYKYRYTIQTPAELPTKTKKPVAQLLAAGALLGGVLLAFLVAALADVFGGLVLESWQVRRRLKLEVLGEIDRSL
jgi:hypothetical protein